MTAPDISRLLSKFGGLKIDAFFVSGQSNVSYLSAFKGLSPNEREAYLFITRKDKYFITFSTNFGLFEKTGASWNILYATPEKRLSDVLNEIIKKEDLTSVGVEKAALTLSEFETYSKNLKTNLLPLENFVEELRLIKSPAEIVALSQAANLTDRAFAFAVSQIKKGITEKELAFKIEFFIKENGGDLAFSPIVAFNASASHPHYFPSAGQKLKDNSLILIDMGARYNNYCADLSRVVFLGTPSGRNALIYNTVSQAQKHAIGKIRPGVKTSSVDKAARQNIQDNGFPPFLHGLGHGVGIDIHESPRLNPASAETFKENMVFTVEPGLYIPGETGVRIEDLLVLRSDGPEFLSNSPKEIIIL